MKSLFKKFPLLLWTVAMAIRAGADSLVEIPPDLKLPAARPARAKWLWGANMLQPFGHSQFTALIDAKDRAARIKTEMGFNTLVIAPADVNDQFGGPADHMTEGQFVAGMEAYRAAGYKIILYTSVMACGSTPEFQDGRLSKKHPDWCMRDPKGNPVLVYGQPWLCPSGPGRDYALKYTMGLVRRYHPDGILLDNSEFYFAPAGWTCHCDNCTKGFRQYLRQRLGESLTKKLFDRAPEQLEIPTREGPLFALWLRYRNRVWAEVNEEFRAQLRKIEPKAIVLANTQYLHPDGLLATDLQYAHEDVLVSESCNLSSRRMSEKMVLGGALAEGRPLWNYIGTFVDGNNYTGLKPVGVVAPLIAATLAHNARPWIVDGFDDGQTNAESRREMASLLGWHAAHPELFDNPPWNPVGVVFSLDARNLLHRPIFPPALGALLDSGVSVKGLRDDDLSRKTLQPFHLIAIETAGTLSETSAKTLAKWVRGGGELIAAPDVGCYDELGQRRKTSTLWEALGLPNAPANEMTVGRGKVVAPSSAEFTKAVMKRVGEESIIFPSGSGIEVTPYQGKSELFLHIVRHDDGKHDVTLRLPGSLKISGTQAQWLSPDSNGAQSVRLDFNSGEAALSLTAVPVYSVVRVPLR